MKVVLEFKNLFAEMTGKLILTLVLLTVKGSSQSTLENVKLNVTAPIISNLSADPME